MTRPACLPPANDEVEQHLEAIADRLIEARENKAHASALVAAIVARKAVLDGTDDWPRIAEQADRCWGTCDWEQLADSAHTPVPDGAIRAQALAMLAQVDTEGAPPAEQMFDLHTARRCGYDTAAAIVADHSRHGCNDWVHLADWLDRLFDGHQWQQLARVHGLRFEITPAIETATTGILRTIGLHGGPTVDQLIDHDTARHARRPLASVPEPALTSCTSCDLTVPTSETDESGHHAEPGWFCDTCAFHGHKPVRAGANA